jgi:hypothetical protein
MTRPVERITVRVPVILVGTDSGGVPFKEKTLATIIANNQATILSSRSLAPGQELELQCIGTNREASARVVEQISRSPEGYIYDLEIRSEDINLWEISFPSAAEPEVAAARVLLECRVCRAQEVALLSSCELEIFHVNQTILRLCRHCNEMTAWVKPSLEKLLASAKDTSGKREAVAIPEAPAGERTQDERKEPRSGLKIPGCIKTSEFGEDVVVTGNVSEGGLCFRSRRTYAPGASVEIALPYVEGGANVFVKARILWSRSLPEAGLSAYGACYVHARRKAKRVRPRKALPVAFIGGGRHAAGSVVDISMTGVLVKCSKEVELATYVRMAIETQQGIIRLGAVAKRRAPGVGMAFEFTTMGQADRMLLRRLILRLAKQM